jgi:CheY-like chemotaxis protein
MVRYSHDSLYILPNISTFRSSLPDDSARSATYPRRFRRDANEIPNITRRRQPVNPQIHSHFYRTKDGLECLWRSRERSGCHRKSTRSDLVVLDMSMPLMNGLDAAREIKKNSPDLAVIMFTMYVTDQLSSVAKTVGIGEVVSKEIGLDVLLISMRAALYR